MEDSQGGTSYCKTLNVKYAEWVDSVLDNVKSNIEHILQIWNSIGFDEKRIERRINILKKELDTCLRSLISEEDKKVASLHKDVEKLETQVINLSNDLGMKVEPTDSDLSLLDRQKLLSETREKLSETISSRMERFKTLSSENQRICEKLGENPKQFSFEGVPSSELLKSMDDEINVLLLKLSHKDDTNSDVSNCKNETKSPECDSARGDSLITSIRDALVELHELYDECLVDSFARDNFPLDCPLESVSTTYLEKINLEIARWKDYRNKFIEAISAYNSWCRSFGRLNEIEDLINQGKGPERLEKEATSLREKILPDLEKLLDLASRRSSKFKIYGQPPTAYVQMIRRSQAKSSVPPKSPKPVISNATAKRPDIKKKKLTSSLKKPCSIPKPAWSFRRTRAKSKNSKLNQTKALSSTSSVQSEPITPKTPIPKSNENKLDPEILSLWTRNKGDGSSTTSQRVGSFTSVINETAPTTPKNRPPLSRMSGKKRATASPTERCRSETRSANKRRISKSFEKFKVPQRRKSSAVFSTSSQESSEQSILDLWYKKKDTSSTSQCGSLASVKSEMAPTTLKTRPPISKIFGKKTTTSSVERLHTGTRSSMQRRVSKSSERFKLPQRRKSSAASSISSQKSSEQSILDLWYKKKDTSSTIQCGSPTSVKSESAFTVSRSKKEVKGKDPTWKYRSQLTPQAARILNAKGEVPLVDLLLPSDNKENDKTLVPKSASGKKMNTCVSFTYSSLSNNASLSSVKSGDVKPPKTTSDCTAPTAVRTPRPAPPVSSSRRPLNRNRNLPEVLQRLEGATGPVPVIELLKTAAPSRKTPLRKK